MGDGSQLVARRRPGGEIAWRAELGDRLLWIDLLDRGVRGPDDPVRLVAHLGDGPPGDDQALMQERSVLVVDGRVVGPWDPRTASAPTSLGRLSVEVDGRRLAVCRSLPPEFGPASAATCPADLALLDGDEEVLATAVAPLAATVPIMVIGGWQATDAGLVVIGEENVVLRGWADLSATWEVDLPANATMDQATVVTTTRGVAISAPGSDPPRVTWYG
ncbi:hypothetical protein [Salsipaludibacter albus]|uniref:hypothetical protein n=1 Tax=Salsipaludibacter albus TaxID=2849650 RepID=UPI001EE3AB15|nr:hypothetical protein [Salsipaludibacter albus]MBY5163073.1 hypothetical protein [Salsipaludibacter albus]